MKKKTSKLQRNGFHQFILAGAIAVLTAGLVAINHSSGAQVMGEATLRMAAPESPIGESVDMGTALQSLFTIPAAMPQDIL